MEELTKEELEFISGLDFFYGGKNRIFFCSSIDIKKIDINKLKSKGVIQDCFFQDLEDREKHIRLTPEGIALYELIKKFHPT